MQRIYACTFTIMTGFENLNREDEPLRRKTRESPSSKGRDRRNSENLARSLHLPRPNTNPPTQHVLGQERWQDSV